MIRERPLWATWANKVAPTLPTAAVREQTLLFVTDKGYSGGAAGGQNPSVALKLFQVWKYVS